MTPARAHIRALARRWSNEVKSSNMACRIPDEIIDKFDDQELTDFCEDLKSFRMTRRQDGFWEETK